MTASSMRQQGVGAAGTSAATIPTAQRPWWHLSRRSRTGLLFLLPAIALITSTILFPLFYAAYSSLFRIRGRNMRFIGLDNYASVLADDVLWRALLTSIQFTLAAVILHVGLGLALALLLDRITLFRSLFRLLLLSPWVVAPSISAVIWMWLLEPQFGIINHVVTGLGIVSSPIEWLGRPDTAFASIVTVDVWRGTPFVMVLLLAALQAIPESQYEAAQIDGANLWQRFRHVTLPNLRYMLIVVSTVDAIDCLKQFDSINVLTGGGPVNATQVVPVLIYNAAFRANKLGEAASIGMLFMLFILVITVVYMALSSRAQAKGR
jgi:multiple sugar transport system permease protein